MTLAGEIQPVELEAAALPPVSTFRRWLAPATFAVLVAVAVAVPGLSSLSVTATVKTPLLVYVCVPMTL